MANVRVIDKGYYNIVRNVEKAKTAFVSCGLHQDAGSNEGVHIAEYAAYNEYGTDNIPSRPFMATTFDQKRGKIEQEIKKEYDNVLQGQATTYDALRRIGIKYSEMIKTTIETVDFLPKLADSTIKAKKGSTRTLIDSGQMRKSVNYKVSL